MTAILDVIIILALGGVIVIGVIRTLLPGSLVDRIVGFDVAVLGFMGLVASFTARSGRTPLVDVLPILGLVAVLGTIAVARAEAAGR